MNTYLTFSVAYFILLGKSYRNRKQMVYYEG